MVIDNLLLFSVCKPENFVSHVKHALIDKDTPMKYNDLLAQHLERRIVKQLPSLFAVMFDECSNGGRHFASAFVSFPAAAPKGFKGSCAEFSPL